jgi:hypothetical protein
MASTTGVILEASLIAGVELVVMLWMTAGYEELQMLG